MKPIRATNIQRMCFDDGPGIRTTVFLKGCSLHCPWCSNPENISFEKQEYFLEERGEKISGCYGTDYRWDELLEILEKDEKFWGDDGGVTFSGGEALLQADALEPLWKELKRKCVSIVAETALFVPARLLEIAEKYIDCYYVDVKILDRESCEDVLGGDVDLFLENVARLADLRCDIHFRVPCSGKYIMEPHNLALLKEFLLQYKEYPVELFSLHHLGDKKYMSLGQAPPKEEPVGEETLLRFQSDLEQSGVAVSIIRL